MFGCSDLQEQLCVLSAAFYSSQYLAIGKAFLFHDNGTAYRLCSSLPVAYHRVTGRRRLKLAVGQPSVHISPEFLETNAIAQGLVASTRRKPRPKGPLYDPLMCFSQL